MESTNENFNINSEYQDVLQTIDDIQNAVSKIIVGQHEMVELVIAALLANGHILLEGVPGVAKTLTAKVISRLVDADFSRIQFTPDLMPSDVLGTNVFNPQTASFSFKKGPVFSQFVLIDEINRAPAKTQAALFEVMEERQVTMDGVLHPMGDPFMVIATQNPIEHEGTYRLPEAQLDRFMVKIIVGYPSPEEEVTILQNQNQTALTEQLDQLQTILSAGQLKSAKQKVTQVKVEHKLLEFIAQITSQTRQDLSLYVGASPRASLALLQLSKALAILSGRDFVIPEDTVRAAHPVLRHRLSPTPEKELEGISTDDIIRDLLTKLEIPR